MTSKTDASSSEQEGEYPSFPTKVGSYLKCEILIDDLLGDHRFQKDGQKSCGNITRDRDEGLELFQCACAQALERECEGPMMSPTDDRPASARAAGIRDADGFRLWFYLFARTLARCGWSKSRRRRELLPVDDAPVEEHPVAANVASPERVRELAESLERTKDLPEKKRLAFAYWLLGYSARESVRLLKDKGITCSHVAVRTWVRDAIAECRNVKARRKAS